MFSQITYHSGAMRFEIKAPNEVEGTTHAKYVLTFATI